MQQRTEPGIKVSTTTDLVSTASRLQHTLTSMTASEEEVRALLLGSKKPPSSMCSRKISQATVYAMTMDLVRAAMRRKRDKAYWCASMNRNRKLKNLQHNLIVFRIGTWQTCRHCRHA